MKDICCVYKYSQISVTYFANLFSWRELSFCLVYHLIIPRLGGLAKLYDEGLLKLVHAWLNIKDVILEYQFLYRLLFLGLEKDFARANQYMMELITLVFLFFISNILICHGFFYFFLFFQFLIFKCRLILFYNYKRILILCCLCYIFKEDLQVSHTFLSNSKKLIKKNYELGSPFFHLSNFLSYLYFNKNLNYI